MTDKGNATERPGTTWTQERVERLRILVDEGLSCAQIARKLDVSRNAIIGKLNRLGLARGRTKVVPRPSAPPTGAPRPGRPDILTRRKILRAVHAAPPTAGEATIVHVERCSLLELAKDKCRWPLSGSEPSDFLFCGNAVVPSLPYCRAHARLAYRPPTIRAQAANAARM